MTEQKNPESLGKAVPQGLSVTTYQTVGPYFKIGLEALYRGDLTQPNIPGQVIEVSGTIFDADLIPVPDAVLELWQADSFGRYMDQPEKNPFEDSFGFGRVPTNEAGQFRFRTIKPGAVQAETPARQAPHILVSIFMRGLLYRLITRIYFSDEPGNANDPLFRSIEPGRQDSLLAKGDPVQPHRYEWNVYLQGENESVFFDL
ncbi:MAG: protocatechuate 3,4-dioxygenase subunit alpha [Verrucomicrobia bacterium]|nr:protocatechuate 3,4-dioxygenase subunit alpha [Verrucomicrobiota bacterium]